MILIRQMKEKDVTAVAELEKAYFSEPWSEKSIRSELDNPLAKWLVAVEADKVLGYIGSQTVLDESDMMNLAVNAENRKQGIGESLVQALCILLREAGSRSLTLEVRASNVAAIGLYEKRGFNQVGRRPGYYFNPKEDALILRKELTE